MKISNIVVGYLEENCYFLEINNKVLIIDPGDEYLKIKDKLKNKELIGILITHHHNDHIGALNSLINDFNVSVYSNNNLEEKIYDIDDFKFEVIKTYGHTTDSLTYYFKEENVMFTGDFIFKETIGRTDLPTGNFDEMEKSIEKIKQFNDNIIIYPGHGDDTTLDYEKKYNYYFI